MTARFLAFSKIGMARSMTAPAVVLEGEPNLALERPGHAVVRATLHRDLTKVIGAKVRSGANGVPYGSQANGIGRIRMVQYIGCIDAKLERLGFGDLDRLANVRVEIPP